MRPLLFTSLLLLAAALPLTAFSNQLKDHPSPYLALHGDDPVQWRDWGKAAFAQARKEQKLLFISSGYFACHWCHVMQRESYQDEAIAQQINRHFIPVKLDRELHPALDAALIDFVRRTRGHAGWPLNVFLTPDGYPLVGLTYSPPDPFSGFMQRLQQRWQAEQVQLQQMARLAASALNPPNSMTRVKIDRERRQQVLIGLLTLALSAGDDLEGGFGQGSRFPMAPQLMALLQLQQDQPDQKLHQLLELTLDQMANQGLRDHLGGGFFRYTVDPGWQLPHFEKMLYTQAQLSVLYLQAARVLKREDYLAVARDTLDFTLEGLAGQQGGFIASLSAIDPEEVEGGGYLWQEQQLSQLLDDQELAFVQQRWGLGEDPVSEHGGLPTNSIPLSQMVDGTRSLADLKSLQARTTSKLLQGRLPRAHPRDSKQLAAWNGLLLVALVQAAEQLQEPRYHQAAQSVRDFLVNRLWDGEQLQRAVEQQRPLGSAALEDYVYVAQGLLAWSGHSGQKQDRRLAARLAGIAWGQFYGSSGWRPGAQVDLPWMGAETALEDGSLASPSAGLIQLSLELGEPQLTKLAWAALEAGVPSVQVNPLAYASYAALIIARQDQPLSQR